MTDEDRKRIGKYMGWEKYPPECMGETVFFRDEIHGDIRWDLNAAALCVQEMQKRGEWVYFYDDLLDTYNGLCEDGKVSCGAENFTAWLFNAENFFNAMSEWLKEVLTAYENPTKSK